MANILAPLRKASGYLSGRIEHQFAEDGSHVFVLGALDDVIELVALNERVVLYQSGIDLKEIDFLTGRFSCQGPSQSLQEHGERMLPADAPAGELLTMWQMDQWVPAGGTVYSTPGIAGVGSNAILHFNPTGKAKVWNPSPENINWLGKAPEFEINYSTVHDVAYIPSGTAIYSIANSIEERQFDFWLSVDSMDPSYQNTEYRQLWAQGPQFPGMNPRPGISIAFEPVTMGGGLVVDISPDGVNPGEKYGPILPGDGWSVGGGPFLFTVQLGQRAVSNTTKLFINGVKKWEGTRTINQGGVHSVLVGGAVDAGFTFPFAACGLGTNIYEIRILNKLRSEASVKWTADGMSRKYGWCFEIMINNRPRARRWIRPGNAQTLEDVKAWVHDFSTSEDVSFQLRLGHYPEDPAFVYNSTLYAV